MFPCIKLITNRNDVPLHRPFLQNSNISFKTKACKYKHKYIQLHLDELGNHQIIGTDAFLHPSSVSLRTCTSAISAFNGRWRIWWVVSTWSTSTCSPLTLFQNIKKSNTPSNEMKDEDDRNLDDMDIGLLYLKWTRSERLAMHSNPKYHTL